MSVFGAISVCLADDWSTGEGEREMVTYRRVGPWQGLEDQERCGDWWQEGFGSEPGRVASGERDVEGRYASGWKGG